MKDMTDNNKPTRRPVAGSRNPATAPRRIAGRSTRPEPSQVESAQVESKQAESNRAESNRAESNRAESNRAESNRAESNRAESAQSEEKQSGAKRTFAKRNAQKQSAQKQSDSSTTEAEPSPAASRQGGALSSAGTTKVLVGLLAALLVVAVVEVGAWTFARFTGSDEPQHVLSFTDDYVVHDDPVTVPMADWRDANDTAMKSVTEILNVSWKDYDQNLHDARKLITDRFEKEYASTTEDSRELFLKNKAEYDFAVVGTSVVEATPDEVATLLFLNQHVYKGEGKQRTGPDVYPVRVMVRMVRTDTGWLIDELRAL
ncbi:hypothetical protein ASG90_08140 [Nocardioides sp. Soil797]|nr:hypothetical protein ASG90_08140 [Nocardioides sp. Soil797]